MAAATSYHRRYQRWIPGGETHAKRTAGADCFALLCEIYAGGRPLSAKDFCLLCNFCSISGMQGAQWALHAQPPGRGSLKRKSGVRGLPKIGGAHNTHKG
eukprot:3962503-Pyramimonas_sp.AAC.2